MYENEQKEREIIQWRLLATMNIQSKAVSLLLNNNLNRKLLRYSNGRPQYLIQTVWYSNTRVVCYCKTKNTRYSVSMSLVSTLCVRRN